MYFNRRKDKLGETPVVEKGQRLIDGYSNANKRNSRLVVTRDNGRRARRKVEKFVMLTWKSSVFDVERVSEG